MIYDISQPVFASAVYPGDPEPRSEQMESIANGDDCNLTAFSTSWTRAQARARRRSSPRSSSRSCKAK